MWDPPVHRFFARRSRFFCVEADWQDRTVWREVCCLRELCRCAGCFDVPEHLNEPFHLQVVHTHGMRKAVYSIKLHHCLKVKLMPFIKNLLCLCESNYKNFMKESRKPYTQSEHWHIVGSCIVFDVLDAFVFRSWLLRFLQITEIVVILRRTKASRATCTRKFWNVTHNATFLRKTLFSATQVAEQWRCRELTWKSLCLGSCPLVVWQLSSTLWSYKDNNTSTRSLVNLPDWRRHTSAEEHDDSPGRRVAGAGRVQSSAACDSPSLAPSLLATCHQFNRSSPMCPELLRTFLNAVLSRCLTANVVGVSECPGCQKCTVHFWLWQSSKWKVPCMRYSQQHTI